MTLSHLALKRSRTVIAGERFKSGVLATVSDEIGRLTKGLATLTTNVRLLTCNTHAHTLVGYIACRRVVMNRR